MKRVFVTLSFTLSIFFHTTLLAQDSIPNHTSFVKGLFDFGTWAKPFWADMHSTITRGEVAYALNSAEYNYGKKKGVYRPYVFTNLGIDIPFWAGDFQNKKFGLSLSLPFAIDVWLDMFERVTAPVINVDYRFGIPDINFIHRFERPRWGIRNYAFKFSLFKHECTHIGDELTISRISKGFPITRVNVSYNFSEVVFTLNDPDGSEHQRHSFRYGVLILLNPKAGFYSIQPNEGDVTLVIPSKYPWETYLQYQYQSKTFRSRLQIITSIEIRMRSKYGYPFYYDSSENAVEFANKVKDEFRLPNFNVFIGVRYNNVKVMKYRTIGVGLRGYSGINPYGQFRSMPIFQQFGIAVMVE